MKRVQMILMTKSYKDGGYCVTGIDCDNGEWIRLVSTQAGGPISYDVIDKNPFKECLDIIEVDLIDHYPVRCQQENFLIDEKRPINVVGRVDIDYVLSNYSSTNEKIFDNRGKAVHIDDIDYLSYSIEFKRVNSLRISSKKIDGKWENRCSFFIGNTGYEDVHLTDPDFRNAKELDLLIEDAAIVVSIPSAPIFDCWFTKFVAKVFVL